MYVDYIIIQIHKLFNELCKTIFTYKCDWNEYIFSSIKSLINISKILKYENSKIKFLKKNQEKSYNACLYKYIANQSFHTCYYNTQVY